MKMKITILEDSVIESERLKNGIRKYGQQYDWDIELTNTNRAKNIFQKILKAQLYRLQHFSLTYKWGK